VVSTGVALEMIDIGVLTEVILDFVGEGDEKKGPT